MRLRSPPVVPLGGLRLFFVTVLFMATEAGSLSSWVAACDGRLVGVWLGNLEALSIVPVPFRTVTVAGFSTVASTRYSNDTVTVIRFF